MRRLGQGPATGIDRVERAYLEFALSLTDREVFGLVATKLGFLLLPREGLGSLRKLVQDGNPPPARDLTSRLLLGRNPTRARSETFARSNAVGRAIPSKLPDLLMTWFPEGVEYVNVGHANLSNLNLRAWTNAENSHVTIFLHDTIPLDFPHFQRPGAVDRFKSAATIAIQRANAITVSSRAVQADLARHFDRLPPITVAPLGVQLSTEFDKAPAVPKPYFLCLGTMEPRKNHGLLLDVWEGGDLCGAPNLVLVGRRGWESTKHFERLDKAKASLGRIFEFNDLPDSELFSLVQNAVALLHPSHAEGFGLPVFEAVAARTPVVAAPLPVFLEQLGDAVVYAEPDKPYQWVEAINRFLTAEAQNAGDTLKPGTPTWNEHWAILYPDAKRDCKSSRENSGSIPVTT